MKSLIILLLLACSLSLRANCDTSIAGFIKEKRRIERQMHEERNERRKKDHAAKLQEIEMRLNEDMRKAKDRTRSGRKP